MKKLIIIFFLTTQTFFATSQSSVSFNHLGNATFQNMVYNPAWIPEGKVFVGLPLLSGIHFNINNKFSYNDIVQTTSTSNIIDVDNVLSKLNNKNTLSFGGDISLFHLGIKAKDNFFGFYINVRAEGDFIYPKQFLEFVRKGNGAFLGETIDIDNIRARATIFTEWGLRYAKPLSENLTVGGSIKLLNGIADFRTPNDASIKLTTDATNYAIDASLKNVILRTAGGDNLDNLDNDGEPSYFIFNSNKGFALDLGAQYKLDKHNFSFSILDAGFISWKEDVKNYQINDTSLVYDGFDLDNIDDISQTIEDSIVDAFSFDENTEAYKSSLPLRLHATYSYDLEKNLKVFGTFSTRFIKKQMRNLYGAGITYNPGRALVLSASVTRLPQQGINFGGAMAVRGGGFQLYLAVDQLLNISVPDANSLDIRAGINLVFGKNDKKDAPSFVSL